MSNLDPRVFKLLSDIHSSATRIMDKLQKETLQGFSSADGIDVQDIVARRLTIIGEAAAALLKKHTEFCEQHPEIPLRQARGMRNILVHEYDGVDWEAVWNTVQDDIPQLVNSIAPFLGEG